MYKEVYNQFYKDNRWKYIIYMMLYIRVPLKQIGMPHFYGKVIGALNKKDTEKTKVKTGNRMLIKNIPVGYDIYNVELHEGKGGQMARPGRRRRSGFV